MIRRLQPEDLSAALRLTRAEQWSHRLEDWQFHYRLAHGWAVCDDDGVLLGTASWWSYGEQHGSVGLVVVDRAQQGKGIGRQLMETIIDDAGSRSLQLIATRAGLKLYQRCGFREVGSIEQRQGTLSSSTLPAPAGRISFRAAIADDFEALAILDAAAFGAPRIDLIRQLLAEATGLVATLDGHLAGFAMKRQSGRGTLIGPVVADTESLAIALVAQTLTSTTGFARIDIPAEASGLARWLDTAGLVRVDTVTAMLLGERPDLHTGVRTFGLVSQALG